MKNVSEWSLQFDLLYQNITSNKAPGLNKYEKSLFLTSAEYVIAMQIYNGSLGRSFESTEDATVYLSNLVKQEQCELSIGNNHPFEIPVVEGLTVTVYKNPVDMLFRTLELCTIEAPECGYVTVLGQQRPVSKQVVVVPVTQDEYWRTSRDPFKKPNLNKVLRLAYSVASPNAADSVVTEEATGLRINYSYQPFAELVSDHVIDNYTVRYVARPDPIILADLTGGLSIDGRTKAMTCKLDEALHQAILEEAVRQARAVWAA